jgi:hypothetical protein
MRLVSAQRWVHGGIGGTEANRDIASENVGDAAFEAVWLTDFPWRNPSRSSVPASQVCRARSSWIRRVIR